MSEQTSNPFFGYCRCGVPGLYAMHEGLVASGRVIWFCQEQARLPATATGARDEQTWRREDNVNRPSTAIAETE
jgi:hypothetical protein